MTISAEETADGATTLIDHMDDSKAIAEARSIADKAAAMILSSVGTSRISINQFGKVLSLWKCDWNKNAPQGKAGRGCLGTE